MSLVKHTIISTGSKGNAALINDFVLIDCGVSFKALKPFYKDIKLVLLTHEHGDHFNKTTIKRLANERPTLRFGCCSWMVERLVATGVAKENIDVYEFGFWYYYGATLGSVKPAKLYHDVPNCGYQIYFYDGPNLKSRVFYATDTSSLAGIQAPNYDLYLIEANHTEAEIQAKIADKKAAAEYAYEIRAAKNHLSKEKADEWIYQNIGPNGQYVYLHSHEDKENFDVK